jgi:prepilin-type N-terminal cleavage/methylation domain-containing protein
MNLLLPSSTLLTRSTPKQARFRHAGGYTLIEMLIAVAIMLLLVGGGIASFITFNDRQALVGAGKQMVTYLRSAQAKARVGDTPSGCERLQSYQVTAQEASNIVTLEAACENGNFLRNTFVLPSGMTHNNDAFIEFRVLQGGVSGDTNFDIISATTGRVYRIQVTQGGEIREVGIVE